jgi:hypothetical protein
VFRSRQRSVVYPQAEHQRLAGVIAAAWGNDHVQRPPLPFESFVRGVTVHDRGYGELDDDPIDAVAPARWIEIQTRGVEPQAGDPVVDLVVAMHVQRLAGNLVELDARVPERIADAGVDPADAAAADEITNLCDRLSFSFCFEELASGSVGSFSYTVSVDGSATLTPWPLGVPELNETVVGYHADGYPERLDRVERVFRLVPA